MASIVIIVIGKEKKRENRRAESDMNIAYHQACINGMMTAINIMEVRLDDDGSPYNNKKGEKNRQQDEQKRL